MHPFSLSETVFNRRNILLAVALLVLQIATLAAPVSAGSLTISRLTLVSGLSPLASGCNGAPQTGTVFQNSEVEPWVAVNPTNPKNIVGVWQQDRWSNGGSQGLLTGVSHNGGKTWTTRMAAFSRCTGGNEVKGGDYERATDPWVTFSPNGIAYQISDSFDATRSFRQAILVSSSADGGDSWSNPQTLIFDTAPTIVDDKESITADPLNSNLVYAVWERFVFPQERASLEASFQSSSFRAPTWFARTTNGGLSWEDARMIFDPGAQAGTIGNQIVVLPNGDLLDFFDLFFVHSNSGEARGDNLAYIRSTDKGLTWSAPFVVDRIRTVGVRDPETGVLLRTSDFLPEVAVDSSNGNLYAVWQDGRFSGFTHEDIAFSMSTDGGFTWSPAVRVNQTPGSAAAFTPSVEIAADGTAAVTYYDLRNNTPDPSTLPTDYWIVHCHSSCTEPANWAENHLAGPFDHSIAPFASGLFIGDYEGLASTGSAFVTFFAITNTGNLANRVDIVAATASL